MVAAFFLSVETFAAKVIVVEFVSFQ
jgi:hypothetical protein